MNDLIEKIVSDIIGGTRKAKTLKDLGNTHTEGIRKITELVKNHEDLHDVSNSFNCDDCKDVQVSRDNDGSILICHCFTDDC